MFLIYSLIYIVALVLIFPFEYFKRPKEIRKRWVREKFGSLDFATLTPNAGTIWVHAVSVGEVLAASPLLKKVKEKYPSKGIILSTVTDTGQKIARERTPEGTTIVYLPFDIPSIINEIAKKARPELLIVMETELWPNLIHVFRGNGIPVIMLNGRISENSFRGYKKVSFFMKRVLSHVDFFGMQDEEYAERIKQLGADSRKVKNLGNFKFDTRPPSKIPGWTEKIKGQTIIAGSTNEGEEEMITSVYLELKKEFSGLNLIVAPRHPERFKPVEDMLKSKGISFTKRSALSAQLAESKVLNGELIILDTVGELSSVYGIADIAIIGKSFRGFGGQNPLEPAFWASRLSAARIWRISRLSKISIMPEQQLKQMKTNFIQN